MELGLSLGDQSTTPFSFLDKPTQTVKKKKKELGFCMALGRSDDDHDHQKKREVVDQDDDDDDDDQDLDDQERLIRSRRSRVCDSDPDDIIIDHNNIHVPLQLDLLPSVPVPRGHMTTSQFRFPWLTDNCKYQYLYFFFPFPYIIIGTVYIFVNPGKIVHVYGT